MEYHLEREIRLSEESEYKSLYSWSLQEFDENSDQIGSDQVPWKWHLYFTASELRHHRTIRLKSTNENEDNESDGDAGTISAILHPGVCTDGQLLEDDPVFSMFGSGRTINQFKLWITRREDENESEECFIFGGVSYTAEMDFVNETTDDFIEIHLYLSSNRFDSLEETIKRQRIDRVQVRIGSVSGVYSEWSPSITTDRVKILAGGSEQKPVRPEGCDIEPPRLGEVGEIEISLTQRNRLNPKQDLRSINIDELFDEYSLEDDVKENDGDEVPRSKETDINSLLLNQLLRAELSLAKLRIPLWLIFILLLLLLLKDVI